MPVLIPSDSPPSSDEVEHGGASPVRSSFFRPGSYYHLRDDGKKAHYNNDHRTSTRAIKRSKSTEANEELLAATLNNLRPVLGGTKDSRDDTYSSAQPSSSRHRDNRSTSPTEDCTKQVESEIFPSAANEKVLAAMLASLRPVRATKRGGGQTEHSSRQPRLTRSRSTEANEALLAAILANLRRARRNPPRGKQPPVLDIPDLRHRAEEVFRHLDDSSHSGLDQFDSRHVQIVSQRGADRRAIAPNERSDCISVSQSTATGTTVTMDDSEYTNQDDDGRAAREHAATICPMDQLMTRGGTIGRSCDAPDDDSGDDNDYDSTLEDEEEARRCRAFVAYNRLDKPTRKELQDAAADTPGLLGLTPADIALLPWDPSGTYVPARAYYEGHRGEPFYTGAEYTKKTLRASNASSLERKVALLLADQDARNEPEAADAKRRESREVRARRVFLWYTRLGCVPRDTLKRAVAALPPSMDITAEDVDLLRWNRSFTRITNMPQMVRDMLALKDAGYADDSDDDATYS